MGNSTYLISTATPPKPPFGGWGTSRRLLCAKNSIPLFWYMLFDHKSFVASEGRTETGEAMPYPALSNSTGAALALAQSRWPRVRVVLGPGADDLFNHWASIVDEHAAAFLHCETWEWSWLFRSPRAFRAHLRTCVPAFDHVPRIRKGEPTPNGWWRELLGQCGALDNTDDNIRPLGDFTYCGIADGIKETPWSDELYEDRKIGARKIAT